MYSNQLTHLLKHIESKFKFKKHQKAGKIELPLKTYPYSVYGELAEWGYVLTLNHEKVIIFK
jgi:hypothetical protein